MVLCCKFNVFTKCIRFNVYEHQYIRDETQNSGFNH